jgi:hypothetical protein
MPVADAFRVSGTTSVKFTFSEADGTVDPVVGQHA